MNPSIKYSKGGYKGLSTLRLMVFDLPFRDEEDGLTLKLTVIKLFLFLEKYKGHTSVVVTPNYTAKFGECYNEELRIEQ